MKACGYWGEVCGDWVEVMEILSKCFEIVWTHVEIGNKCVEIVWKCWRLG